MILNTNSLDLSLQNTWSVLANKLDGLGYNIKIDSGRKGASVFEKESGEKMGGVTREMIEDEEVDYILYQRLHIIKKEAE